MESLHYKIAFCKRQKHIIKLVKLASILMLYCCFSSYSFGQEITVRSTEDNSTVPGVKAVFKPLEGKDKFRFISNHEGKIVFTNEVTAPGDFEVLISSFGFDQLRDTLSLTKNSIITIYIIPQAQTYGEVVVTAQYKAQQADNSVHQIRVIDEEQIKRMAAQNLKDALSNSMNIRLGEDNILGSRMQLQGIGGQNVKILIDGVPMTGRLDGNIDLSQIPMENVARIEIVEGPLSVQYGTDALAGTINIITKKSNTSTWNFQSTNYYESNGRFNNSGQFRWGKKKHQLVLNGGRYFFDGWNPEHANFFYDRAPIADSSRVMTWNPKEQFFGNLNYRFQAKKFTLNYSTANFTEEVINRGAPRPPYEQKAFDDYYKTTRLNQRLRLNYKTSDYSSLNIIMAYNGFFRRKNTYIRDLTTIEDVLSANSTDQDTSNFHTVLSRGTWNYAKDSSKVSFSLGYDFNHDVAQGVRIEQGEQSITDMAIFGSMEYTPVERLTLRPGLRWAYNSDYAAPVIPSFNLMYNLLQAKKTKLDFRGSYARGFRSPSIKELHFFFVDVNHNIQGNEDLTAETSHNTNASFTLRHRLKSAQLKTSIRAFYNDISNMITLAQQDQTAFSYFNLDRFKTAGLQFQSGIIKENLNIQVGVGYIGRYNQFSEISSTTQFLYSPEAQLSVQSELFNTGINANLFYKYTGELPNVIQNEDGEIEQRVMEDFHMFDLTVSRSFFDDAIQFSTGIKNALDVRAIMGAGNSGGAHSSGNGMVQVGTGRTYFTRLIFVLKPKNK